MLALCPETASVTKLRYITDFETRQDLTDLVCAAPPSGGRKFPCVFRRKPLCRRVLHFAISLENNTAGEDLSISSAEVYFEILGKVR